MFDLVVCFMVISIVETWELTEVWNLRRTLPLPTLEQDSRLQGTYPQLPQASVIFC
jgi:hypothetical protein